VSDTSGEGAARSAPAGTGLDGIDLISVPTPFAVGPVNCYLLEGRPLTLVDTGPNSGTSLDALQRGLATRGHAIEELELILLTHYHLDHIGLVDVLQRRSGAQVAGHPDLGPWLAGFPASAERDDRWAQALMRRHGVPEDLVGPLGLVARAYRPYGSRGQLTLELQDGDRLRAGGRELRVLHRPGHSPTDIVLYDERDGIMLGGDHLLAHISSNALLARPPSSERPGDADRPSAAGATDQRPRSLLRYAHSLRATRALHPRLVLGGHGDPVRDAVALIDARLAMQRRRADKILALLRDRPQTAHQLARRMWGNVALTQAYLTLSEVLGHLDLLVQEGAATEQCDRETALFCARG
jgi:glyoxylase-like metal-dependent hydrolase (beta-lactamase superfamily II)